MNRLLFLKDPVFYFALVVALTFVSSYTWGIGYALYYPMIIFSAFYLNMDFSKSNVFSVFGFFLLACFVSLLVNVTTIMPVFEAPLRFIAFIILIMAFTPILYSEDKVRDCYRFMLYSCFLLIIVGFINFYLYKSGTIQVDEGNKVYAGTIGTNYLGMLCSIGIVYLASLLMYNNGLKRKYIVAAVVLLLGLVLCLLLSSSRNSIVSVAVSIIVMLYIRNKGSIKKTAIISFVVIMIAFLTFTLWENYTIGIVNKQGGNLEQFDMRSRENTWNVRLAEFKSNPITGIGFANISNPSQFSLRTGIVETTTGWGALFSQLGLLGAIPFIILTVKNLIFLLSHREGGYVNCLLIGLFVFFCINSVGEGYITTPGCQFTIYFWMVQGIIYAIRKEGFPINSLKSFFVKV